jgi:hypothetical protein
VLLPGDVDDHELAEAARTVDAAYQQAYREGEAEIKRDLERQLDEAERVITVGQDPTTGSEIHPGVYVEWGLDGLRTLVAWAYTPGQDGDFIQVVRSWPGVE